MARFVGLPWELCPGQEGGGFSLTSAAGHILARFDSNSGTDGAVPDQPSGSPR